MEMARHVAQVRASRITYNTLIKDMKRSGNEGEDDTNINLTKIR
jgi:hypothetical protein